MPPSSDPQRKIRELEHRLLTSPASALFLPLAEAYRQEGQLQDAELVLRQGLEHHPEHHSARTALARVLLAAGRPDEARRELGRVLTQVPENLLARKLFLDCEGAAPTGPEPAVEPPGAAGAQPPTTPEPPPSPADELSTVTLGELYLAQGNRAAALEIYRDVLRREPENEDAARRLRELSEAAPGPAGDDPAPATGEAAPDAATTAAVDPRLVALRRLARAAARLRGPHAR